jgi:mannose-1-phosphate guanylyltransferase
LAQGNAKDGNVTEARGMLGIDARNNYVYSPEKFVALVGVDDLVVVETEDAILITTRDRSQDVRRVVSELAARNHDELI